MSEGEGIWKGTVEGALADELAGIAGTFEESQSEGQQVFSVDRGKHELKVVTEERKYLLERLRTEAEIDEDRKDNDQRRCLRKVSFVFVIGVGTAALVAGFAVVAFADNDDTRRWAQSLVTLLVGAVAGGFAGYVTGKGDKER